MNLEGMKQMATKVAAEHDALEHAKADRDMAEEELLAQVIEVLRPALPAMCSKLMLPTEHINVPPGAAAPWTRALLIGEVHGGSKLYLEEDGVWCVITPMGFTHANQSDGDVLEMFDITEIVSKLAAALNSQVGARDASIERATTEAERFRALVTLLKPSPPKQRHPKRA